MELGRGTAAAVYSLWGSGYCLRLLLRDHV